MKACILLAALISASPALADEQPPCAPWKEMKQSLAEKFHEFEIGGGLINEKTLMAVFASSGGATWTTIAVSADGTACVLTVGTNWFLNKPSEPAPGGRQS